MFAESCHFERSRRIFFPREYQQNRRLDLLVLSEAKVCEEGKGLEICRAPCFCNLDLRDEVS